MNGLEILVRPGASRNEVAGEHDGALVVRLTSPPADGRANDALRRLVAKRLRVSRSSGSIARGERDRRKLLVVAGLEPTAVRRALLGSGGPGGGLGR
jgi:uncharacterized protein YggU (UPF0235/DUF167 family)